MNKDLFLNLNLLFIFYSFLGYVIEVSIAAIKKKKDINRGILNGPFCISYGFLSIILFISSWITIYCQGFRHIKNFTYLSGAVQKQQKIE